MAIAEAAAELLPLLGRSGEFAKLGSESEILGSIRNQLRNLVGAGLSIGEAANTLRNRSSPAPINVGNPRTNQIGGANQDFISRVSSAARSNVLRQRRPIYEQVPTSEQMPTIQNPISTNSTIHPRVIFKRPTVNNTARILGAGGAIAGTAAVIAAPSNTSSEVKVNPPDNTTTTPPDTTPLEHMPRPIRTPPTPANTSGLLPITKINTLLDVINQNNSDMIYNPGLRGRYKYPNTYWDESTASKYMNQEFFNAMQGI